ncbi:WD repeat-containing protein 82 [Colletotrichum spaethianum]|uniref:Mitochondrial division protein 1 n=1 Tax=Colletotrichum spaethianum TaxID=700344 RepID=A0AA37UND8_9PEZI|nr:WD repeat-containing protein 82 [Colletotrichum spaethianum]GKT48330.1 WD repeat-containing protein 82 [Colletotrichum spaethianum]
MSDLDSSAAATPLPEPPPKRRKVLELGTTATPRSSSPDELNSPAVIPIGSAAAATADRTKTTATKRTTKSRRLAAHRSRPSVTPSRSPSDDELNEAYYSRSSHSRTRSQSRSRSPSRSRTRTPRSPTASPSRSRSESRTRSQSPASTSAGSSPRSLSGAVDRRLRLSSTNGEGADTGATVTTPVTPAPTKKGPVRPRFEEQQVLSGHAGKPVSQVRISPDGRWIASASADGTIKLWDAATGEHMDTLVGHMAGVSCVAWSPDSGTLASGSDDKAIRLWDRVTGRPKSTAKGVGALAKDGAVAPSARPMPPLRGHHNYVMCLAFSPKGNILASGSYDEAVFLWDVRAGRLMRSLPAHSDPVSGIDFCGDGTLVVSCSTDGLIRIWDTYTGQCLRTLVHEDNPAVTSVCFAPNGRFVLAFNLDNSIRLWDYVAGSVKKTYQGHANSRFAIGGCFGLIPCEGAFVASASEDGEIVLWDVVTKEVVQRIPAHTKKDRVNGAGAGGGKRGSSVCFWVDVHGDVMVSAGQDGTIRRYKRVPSEGEDGGGDAVATAAAEATAAVTNGHAAGAAEEEDKTDEVETTEPPIKQEEDIDMGGT